MLLPGAATSRGSSPISHRKCGVQCLNLFRWRMAIWRQFCLRPQAGLWHQPAEIRHQLGWWQRCCLRYPPDWVCFVQLHILFICPPRRDVWCAASVLHWRDFASNFCSLHFRHKRTHLFVFKRIFGWIYLRSFCNFSKTQSLLRNCTFLELWDTIVNFQSNLKTKYQYDVAMSLDHRIGGDGALFCGDSRVGSFFWCKIPLRIENALPTCLPIAPPNDANFL